MNKQMRETYYKNNLYNTCARFKLDYNVKAFISRLCRAIRDNKQIQSKWFDILGFSYAEFKSHIECYFRDGMSWDNYGTWHIDHLIPKCHFIYSDENQWNFKQCWALYNYRPLEKQKNLKKYNKIGALVL